MAEGQRCVLFESFSDSHHFATGNRAINPKPLAAAMNYPTIYPPLDDGSANQVPGQQPLQNQHAPASTFAQYMYSTYPNLVPAPQPGPPQPSVQAPPQVPAQTVPPANHRPIAPALVLS